MSAIPQSPPETPVRPSKRAAQNGGTDPRKKVEENSSQEDMKGSFAEPESLVIREASDRIQVPSTCPAPVEDAYETPQPDIIDQNGNCVSMEINGKSANPHILELFDWEDFETRYNDAMEGASEKEAALLKEFYEMAEYFGIWADAASQHDDDRAIKRLKTREVYVQQAERSLEEKRKHYTQVVEAFKNALALLSGH